MSGAFAAGLDRLNCRIIADYLIARGWRVLHLMGPRRTEPAQLTPAAQCEDGVLVYRA